MYEQKTNCSRAASAIDTGLPAARRGEEAKRQVGGEKVCGSGRASGDLARDRHGVIDARHG
jgi:hypothetical protein